MDDVCEWLLVGNCADLFILNAVPPGNS